MNNINNYYLEPGEDMLQEKLAEGIDKMVIDEIIDIYNGKFDYYDEYKAHKAVEESVVSLDYPHFNIIVSPVIPEKLFSYIISKRGDNNGLF